MVMKVSCRWLQLWYKQVKNKIFIEPTGPLNHYEVTRKGDYQPNKSKTIIWLILGGNRETEIPNYNIIEVSLA